MGKKIIFSLLLLPVAFISLSAQETFKTAHPVSVKKAHAVTVVPGLATKGKWTLASTSQTEAKDKKSGQNVVVYGKGLPHGQDPLVTQKHYLTQKVKGKAPSLVFDGAVTSKQPTDPSGAVGPNHYLLTFNKGFRIFDKSGNPLTGQLDISNIFPDDGCCDITCTYDVRAGRFVMTLLGFLNVQVAVSQTSDPLNDGWYVYNFPIDTDYQKLSIWSDGYYLTNNKDDSSAGESQVVYALERAKMLTGDSSAKIIGFPLPGIVTNGFYSPQVLNVSGANFPTEGNVPVVFFQDDAWEGVTQDHLKIWNINVDWNTPENSTITQTQNLITTPFTSVFDGGSFSNLTQPNNGSDVDALQSAIMNQAQFRKFSDHNAAVFNFVVDADNSTGELAAVRWYELRQSADGQLWSIYQEGTYTAANGKHAWNASMGIDIQGNIGMGYTGMGGTNNQVISSYYTGRHFDDPLGTMTIAEETIALGNGNITGNRYGDYSKVAIDPVDDKTFWYANEYYNSARKDVVGVFKLATDYNYDVGVVSIDSPVTGSLTASENLTVTLYNYGLNDVSNFPLSFQIDGGSSVTENFTDVIPAGSYATFTFTATGDFSTEGHAYSVSVYSALSGDENTTNDTANATITHLFANNIGISKITSPANSTNLGMEPVTVTITNYGGLPQSNFNVSYIVDTHPSVTEQVTQTVNPNSSVTYTFSALADFSAIATYNLTASTHLVNDAVPANDAMSKSVNNLLCAYGENNSIYSIGPNAGTETASTISFVKNLLITKAIVNVNLTHTRDSDLKLSLLGPEGTEIVLSAGNGMNNDNYTDTSFDDDASIPVTLGNAPFTGSFRPEEPLSAFNGISSYGDWVLKIKDYANAEGGNLLNWSLDLCYDEDVDINSEDLKAAETSDNVFDIYWITDTYNDPLTFSVFNMLGQKVVNYEVSNINGKYFYHLDMRYAATGVYIVRLGDNGLSKVRKIIVK